MTAKQIEKDMKSFNNGSCWISKTGICKYLSYDRKSNHIEDLVRGLPKFYSRFSVTDVSERIFANLH